MGVLFLSVSATCIAVAMTVVASRVLAERRRPRLPRPIERAVRATAETPNDAQAELARWEQRLQRTEADVRVTERLCGSTSLRVDERHREFEIQPAPDVLLSEMTRMLEYGRW